MRPCQRPGMTDAERVLSVLIHDLRTPLGVAHGYLRLIRGNKLPSADDRDKALASTQDALARISRLCQDASGFLEETSGAAAGRTSASDLAGRVSVALAERGVTIADPPEVVGSVEVGASVDRAAEAIATLLAIRCGRTAAAVVTVQGTPGELRFDCGPAGANRVLDAAAQPFDPWRVAPGLSVALAHRLVVALGGRVWTAKDGLALALSLPRMESGNA
jgi:signal transduction histidine kinase